MKKYLFLGIDGGGTQTKTALISKDSERVADAVWESINYNSVGEEQVVRVLEKILTWAYQHLEKDTELLGIGICAAGTSNINARHIIQKTIDSQHFQGKLLITGDQKAALMGALGHMNGVVLIVGTGSICYGMDSSGREARTGGWGHRIDDVGSGYDLGRCILAAIVQAHDGRGPQTVLTDLVFDKYQFSSIEDVIHFVYSPNTHKQTIAALSTLLEPAFVQHDPVAIKIANRAVQNWVQLVTPVVESLHMQNSTLSLCGGVASKNTYMQKLFSSQIAAIFPSLQLVPPKASAAVGAAWLVQYEYTSTRPESSGNFLL